MERNKRKYKTKHIQQWLKTILKYIPIGNIKLLPDYLHEGIDCEPSMAPVILSDILHSLYNTEK